MNKLGSAYEDIVCLKGTDGSCTVHFMGHDKQLSDFRKEEVVFFKRMSCDAPNLMTPLLSQPALRFKTSADVMAWLAEKTKAGLKFEDQPLP